MTEDSCICNSARLGIGRGNGGMESIESFGPLSEGLAIAPDYGYKRQSTNREAHRAYTQPEGMGYLVRVMFYGRSNFGNF